MVFIYLSGSHRFSFITTKINKLRLKTFHITKSIKVNTASDFIVIRSHGNVAQVQIHLKTALHYHNNVTLAKLTMDSLCQPSLS